MSIRITHLKGALGAVEHAEEAMQTIGYEEYPRIQEYITLLLSLLDEAIREAKEEGDPPSPIVV